MINLLYFHRFIVYLYTDKHIYNLISQYLLIFSLFCRCFGDGSDWIDDNNNDDYVCNYFFS
ncbi:uncharacterized protein DC041_0001471 [Schistosoma bovis]|uniref:Uncharacterized protein n=1 Tax=Schistosoma bovis TaxID=6184 RepID=A0A430QD76_SCHBO|nr:uncharacterized protein DC041_0001471 [Schistosoma bovis]